MSTEGAAHFQEFLHNIHRVPPVPGSIPIFIGYPGLTAGATLCRPFGPLSLSVNCVLSSALGAHFHRGRSRYRNRMLLQSTVVGFFKKARFR